MHDEMAAIIEAVPEFAAITGSAPEASGARSR